MFSGRITVVLILLSVVLSLSLTVGVTAAALARWDSSSIPTALARAGVAFGSTLSLGIAFIALVVAVWP